MDTLSSMRQKAYYYIREMALTPVYVDRRYFEDEVEETAYLLSDELGLLIDDLRNLKDGNENPSEQVLAAFKKQKLIIDPNECKRYLIDPFV